MTGKKKEELFKRWNGVFEPSYFELRRFVRVGGLESDIRLLDPFEFGAETSELVQMLQKGHYGVELDGEAWDRLYTLVFVPAGRSVMSDPDGCEDERPLAVVEIKKPFWMGRCEVTNEQYERFDPSHDSRFEHKGSWVFWEHHLGWPLNRSKQPVVRVSHREAQQFCHWLSQKTGERVALPTEAQWEYACRAGTASPFWYGDFDADFSNAANMADITIRQLAYDTDGRHTADLVPRDARFDDKSLVTADVGSYRPNVWGLNDMHGNVWEWTRSAYRPYPHADNDGRNAPQENERLVVRGGSWRDRPQRCRSAYRLSYSPWQRVYNVGFRIVCEIP